jgi:hypothetical protein
VPSLNRQRDDLPLFLFPGERKVAWPYRGIASSPVPGTRNKGPKKIASPDPAAGGLEHAARKHSFCSSQRPLSVRKRQMVADDPVCYRGGRLSTDLTDRTPEGFRLRERIERTELSADRTHRYADAGQAFGRNSGGRLDRSTGPSSLSSDLLIPHEVCGKTENR